MYDKYYDETEDETKTVVLSTASPYKFVNDVLTALDERRGKTEIESLRKLEEVTALPLPETLAELHGISVDEMITVTAENAARLYGITL